MQPRTPEKEMKKNNKNTELTNKLQNNWVIYINFSKNEEKNTKRFIHKKSTAVCRFTETKSEFIIIIVLNSIIQKYIVRVHK